VTVPLYVISAFYHFLPTDFPERFLLFGSPLVPFRHGKITGSVAWSGYGYLPILSLDLNAARLKNFTCEILIVGEDPFELNGPADVGS
jgi:hypothetical protein